MLHTMMLNEPLARTARAPLTDVYDCSEHFHTTWCRGHPGKSPDLNFDYLARRADAVETGRLEVSTVIMFCATFGLSAKLHFVIPSSLHVPGSLCRLTVVSEARDTSAFLLERDFSFALRSNS